MNKIINKKSLIILGIIISLFLSFSPTLYAEDATDTTDIKCTIEMKPFLKEKSAEFQTYMDGHFKNKSKNSTLLDLALKRFQIYKQELNKKLQTYFPQAGLPIYSEAVDALQCAQNVENEIKLMEQLFTKYFKKTSDIKTTSSLMTKLEAMNKKLDDLSRKVATMYGKWESLKNRIPCFVKKCISG